MVADDREKRDIGGVEITEGREGAHQIGEVWPAVVKQIARVDDGVDIHLDGVVDDGLKGREEVRSPLRRVVLLVADVGVASV